MTRLPLPIRFVLSALQVSLGTLALGATAALPHVETEDGVIALDMTFLAVVLTALVPVGAALFALAMFG